MELKMLYWHTNQIRIAKSQWKEFQNTIQMSDTAPSIHETLELRPMRIGPLSCLYAVHQPFTNKQEWICYWNGDEEFARVCARAEILEQTRIYDVLDPKGERY